MGSRRMFRIFVLRFLLAILVAITPSFALPQEQSEDQELDVAFQQIQIAEDEKVYAMPEVTEAVPGSYRVGTTDISIERHDEMVSFKAVTGTTERVQWVSDTDKYGRFVYNADKKRFERLSNSVRIEMEDYGKLEALIEETDATSGEAFPELDFALIRLPKETHPAKYVAKISDRAEVKVATVEIEEPRQIPH